MVSAAEVIALANRHVGERYVLGAFAPKDNPNWTGPWDCAEFVSWIVFQSTGLLLGCTNNGENPARADAYSGAWARDAAHADLRIGLGQAKAMPGAVLVRKPAPKGIGHVAFSQGDGTTVEAHSTKLGVVNGKVDGRRWDLAMRLPLVDHPQPGLDADIVFTPPAGLVLRDTFPPMQGALIERLQKALKAAGFDPGLVDGVFGPHTEAAVRAFQLVNGLVADGEAGRATLKKLGLATA